MSEYIGKRYQVIKLIGRGGMADVYLALDTILNREVAIKVLKTDMSSDPVALERFKREAGSATCLSHPNIVDVYDVGDDEDKHYIVMEYVKGCTLKQLIHKRGAIPYKEAVWLMKQLTGALMEAHRNGIIHRDIKSQNVLIKDDGTVKMADFGIALANDAIQITSKDSVLGSVHYLAPELVKGGQATMQSDIYSLGIVFYELLTGDVPFKGDTPAQVALAHIKSIIPSVRSINPDIPQSVENILLLSTAKSPDNRYANAALMLKDLSDCLKSEHLNDNRAIIDESAERKVSESITIKEEKPKKTQEDSESKTYSRLSAIFIVLISLISIISLAIVLMLSGILDLRPNRVMVPDLQNLSIVEANDLLEEHELNLDYSSIERVMTDDIEAGLIISFTPAYETEVEKGTKIHIVVSAGIYSVMNNYVGRDIEDVRALLANTNIIIKATPVESDEKSGTILSQEGLLPNNKYNSNESNTVIFTYSDYKRISITNDQYLGRSVYEVYDELYLQGFKVEIIFKDASYFTDDEIATYNSEEVVRIDPENEIYIQNDDTKIIIYSYQ
ncbi:MAG: Stk1 family PASTA domain-containing Ser/Thr kinase [Erysipelotrichaceae bacterium]|nr:Stk1 family PASTA domain-containing Ser/Thr kinase [Erysipelotrichaceae bacterium]